jgi:FKBP-type peptidyl-prolyl cis-trans isomerase FklB
MHKILSIALFILGSCPSYAQDDPQPRALKNSADSASYAFGQLVGANLARQLPPGIDIEIAMKAMNAAINGREMYFDAHTASNIFTAFSQKAQGETGEKNKAIGKSFLEENKKRPGVTATASGLQYEVLKRGTGTASPVATSKVKVHYHGTTIDGGVFDSSVERNDPIVFGLNQVIPGWTEGVQLMRVGDKFKFFIPSELAYGEQSPSPKIPAHSTLVFEVELLEIVP